MHATPRGGGQPAVQFVPIRADLDDGRTAGDHRHDALVVVSKGRAWLACDVSQDVPGRPISGLLCHGPELGESAARRVWRISAVAENVDGGEPRDREVRLDVDPAAVALRQAGAAGERRRHQAASPDHDTCLDRRVVGKQHVAGANLLHARLEP